MRCSKATVLVILTGASCVMGIPESAFAGTKPSVVGAFTPPKLPARGVRGVFRPADLDRAQSLYEVEEARYRTYGISLLTAAHDRFAAAIETIWDASPDTNPGEMVEQAYEEYRQRINSAAVGSMQRRRNITAEIAADLYLQNTPAVFYMELEGMAAASQARFSTDYIGQRHRLTEMRDEALRVIEQLTS